MSKPVEVLLTNLAELFKVKTLVTLTLIGVGSYGFVKNLVSAELYAAWVTAAMTYYFTRKETPSS